MRILALVFALLAMPGCTAMLLGNNSTPDRTSTGPAPTQSSADRTISGTIRAQYGADPQISGFPLGVRSAGGRVTLTGTVGSYDVRDRVVDIARNTHGVVSVDSRVVVNTNL